MRKHTGEQVVGHCDPFGADTAAVTRQNETSFSIRSWEGRLLPLAKEEAMSLSSPVPDTRILVLVFLMSL